MLSCLFCVHMNASTSPAVPTPIPPEGLSSTVLLISLPPPQDIVEQSGRGLVSGVMKGGQAGGPVEAQVPTVGMKRGRADLEGVGATTMPAGFTVDKQHW